MTYDIDAIYDHGVFRPLEPLAIPDGMRVHLRIAERTEVGAVPAELSSEECARRRAEIDDFRRVMAELPIESPNDGFSGADHDRLLYGKP